MDIDLILHLPAFARALSEGYHFTTTYTYMDQYGVAPLYWRIRLDHPNGSKFIRPVHQKPGDVYDIGEPDHIKTAILKPLYNQHLLYKYLDAKIWVVEGEKCADKLNAVFEFFGIFGQHVCITSGSATSGDKADLGLLSARRVTIWPDNDQEGQTYATTLSGRLQGQAEVMDIVDVCALGLGAKEDCVDWFDQHPDATLEQLLSLPLIETLKPKNEVDIIRMSDLEMKPVNWLWPDRIACGKVTLIAGNPGLGKSQITAMLAAHVTQGYAWPDCPDIPVKVGSVIFLSAEDDPADTILPRLKAADADISRCHALQAIKIEGPMGQEQLRGFDLSQDLGRLRSVIDQFGDVRLIVIDPVSAYMGKTKDNNNAEIRGLLTPLSALSSDTGAAIVLITHLNKSTAHDAIGRVIGSIGMIAAARAGYAVSKDPQNPDIRYFVPLKNNIGNDQDGFSFTIQGVKVTDEIETSRIIWGEVIEAQRVLYPEDDKPTQANGASEFLTEVLGEGPKPAAEIFAEGEGPGYSKGTLRRAKQRLGIKHRKMGMDGGWEWYLPREIVNNAQSIVSAYEEPEGAEGDTILSVASSVETVPTS